MNTDARSEYRYTHLTWQEMNEAIGSQKVVLLPTGSTEQHGPHLPLDVDAFLVEKVCMEVGRRMADRVLVMPTVFAGMNLHHIDFPGTIHISPEAFVGFCLSITKSLAYHGFKKILIVNGHGSNTHLVELVARKTVLETESLCANVNYYRLGEEAFERIRETSVSAHAEEYETSLYLYLAPERVQMDKAAADLGIDGKYVSPDSANNAKIRLNDYWGRWAKIGVHGDPTRATAEKGRIIFEACVAELVDAIHEWDQYPINSRLDHHTHPIQSNIRW